MTYPAAVPKPCSECRKGPAFRLDVNHVQGDIYSCCHCGMRWRLVEHMFRRRHEPVEQLPGIGKRFKR